MAFSAVTGRGSTVAATSASSVAVSVTANIVVGRIVCFAVMTESRSATDGATNDHSSLSGFGTNTLTKVAEYSQSNASATDGSTISLWVGEVTQQINSGASVSCNLAGAMTQRSAFLFEATGSIGLGFLALAAAVGQNSLTASASGLENREHLFVYVAASRGSDSTKTAPTNFAENFDSRTGTGATNLAVYVATRIVTATSQSAAATAWTTTANTIISLLVPIIERQNNAEAPEAGALVLAGTTPTLVEYNPSPTITPASASLSLAGQAVSLATAITLSAASLVLAGTTPTLTIGTPGSSTDPSVRASYGVNYAGGNGSAGLTVDLSSTGWQPGDVAWVTVVADCNANTLAAPAGWSRAGSLQRLGGQTDYGFYYRKLQSGDANTHTWTVSGSATASANRGVVIQDGGNVVASDSASGLADLNGAFNTPSLTPTGAEQYVSFAAGVYDVVTFTAPTNYTERVDTDSVSFVDRIHPTSSATGALSWDSTGPNQTPYAVAGIIVERGSSGGATIAVPAGALTLAGAAPALATAVATPAGALTLSGATPALRQQTTIAVPAGALVLESTAPSLNGAAVVAPAAGVLAISGAAPALALTIAASTGAVVLTGTTPTLTSGLTLAMPAGTLTLTGTTPAAVRAHVVAPTAGALALTGTTPVVRTSQSIRFYGGGNASTVDKVYIPCAPGDAVNVGDADFTIEFFVRMPTDLQSGTATAGANYSWINSPIIVDRDILDSVGSGGDWGISVTDGRITFGIENSTGSQRTILGTTDLRDNRRHHVAVTRQRSTGDLAIYVDGVREASFAGGPSGDVHVASNSNNTNTWNRYLCLGGEKHALDWPQGQWRGWIDELRISTSLRYTGSSYTVPTADFAVDGSTAALYHCDDGSGTTLSDATGNANGTLNVGGVSNGPQWDTDGWQEWPTAARLPAAGVLTLTGQTPTRVVDHRAVPGSGALALAGQTPTLTLTVLIAPAAGTLAVTGTLPAVRQDLVTAPAAAALSLTGQTPVRVVDHRAAPAAGALVLTGTSPVRVVNHRLSPAAGGLVLTGTAGTVRLDLVVSPAAAALVLTGSTVATGGAQTLAPGTGTMALAGGAVALRHGVAVPAGTLVLTGTAPSLGATARPAAAALTLTGVAPTLGVRVAVPGGALALTGTLPALVGQGAIAPQSAALALTGQTPQVLQRHVAVPGSGALVLGATSPALAYTLGPAAGALTLTGSTPALRLALVSVPAAGALTLTGAAPALVGQGAQLVPAGALTLAGQPLSALQAHRTAPATGALALTGVAPALTGTVTVAPAVGTMVLTGTAPAGRLALQVAPAAGALTLTGALVTTQTDARLSPAAGALTLTGAAPTLAAGRTAAPGAGALVLTGTTPAVVQAHRAAPAAGALALTGSTPALVGQGAILIAAAPLTLSGTTPTLRQDLVVAPTAGALALTGATSTLALRVAIEAGALALTGTLPSTGTRVTPATAGLVLTGTSPATRTAVLIAVAGGAVTLTGAAPAPRFDYVASPGAASLTFVGVEPYVQSRVPETTVIALSLAVRGATLTAQARNAAMVGVIPAQLSVAARSVLLTATPRAAHLTTLP